MRVIALLIFVSLSCLNSLSAQSEILAAVKKEDKNALLYQIRKGKDLNTQEKPENYTPLTYAVKCGVSTGMLTWLLEQGADPDKQNNGKTPIMYAIKYSHYDLIDILIEKEANVDIKNSANQTALMYATAKKDSRAIKQLLSYGADPDILDHKNRSAVSLARKTEDPDLMSLFGIKTKLEFRREGPHLFFQDDSSLISSSILPSEDSLQLKKLVLPLKKGKARIRCTSDQGLVSHTFPVNIDINNIPPTVQLDSMPKELYVFSDLNGNFHAIRAFLVDNKLVDIHFNWIAGNANLILLGDIFALGDNITPTLWLIYEMSQQALAQGGAVHLLLGNRELEVLLAKAKNLHPKYKAIAKASGEHYEDLFSNQTVLGHWLRQQRMLLKMDSTLFAHAGIQQGFIDHNLDIDETNRIIHKALNGDSLNTDQQVKLDFLLGDKGPTKFKGMGLYEMNQRDVDLMATFFGVNRFVIGQRRVTRSKYIYQSKVLLTNTPKPKSSAEGKSAGIFFRDGYPLIIKDKRKLIEI